MFKKILICLIIATSFSCKPSTLDSSRTVSNHETVVKLDILSAKNQICRSLDEIEGFEDFESYGGELVGSNGHSIYYGFIDDMYIIVLEKLSHRSSEGEAHFKILDIDSVKNTTENQQVRQTSFQHKENASNEFMNGFVTIKNDTCDQILKSWSIDFENNKLIELDTDEIELTNNWFGYDG